MPIPSLNAAHLTVTVGLVLHVVFLHRRAIASALVAVARFLNAWDDETKPPLP